MAGVSDCHGGAATVARVAQELFDMVALELENIERFPEDIGSGLEESMRMAYTRLLEDATDTQICCQCL